MKQHRCPHGHYVGYLGTIDFQPGIIGEIQAKTMIDDLCRDGCPNCGSAMIREADYKAYCSNCGVGFNLIPPNGEPN